MKRPSGRAEVFPKKSHLRDSSFNLCHEFQPAHELLLWTANKQAPQSHKPIPYNKANVHTHIYSLLLVWLHCLNPDKTKGQKMHLLKSPRSTQSTSPQDVVWNLGLITPLTVGDPEQLNLSTPRGPDPQNKTVRCLAVTDNTVLGRQNISVNPHRPPQLTQLVTLHPKLKFPARLPPHC